MADEDVKIVIKQKGTIPVYTKTKVGVNEVHHDETLKGSGTTSAPLGISDEVMEEIENTGKVDDVRVDGVSVVTDKIAEIDLTGKVDKTSEADKVYGTDENGLQTTYDIDSFGQVDDVLVNGTSVVSDKVASVTVPTKVSDLTNDSDFQTGTEVENAIATHNSDTEAHPDIRAAISSLNEWTTAQYTPTTTNFVVGQTYTVEEAFQRTASLFEGQQGEIDDIEAVIPAQATAQNQLADKNFVNATVATNSANFRGNWATWTDVPTQANLYPEDYVGNKTPTNNDYMVVTDASDYISEETEVLRLVTHSTGGGDASIDVTILATSETLNYLYTKTGAWTQIGDTDFYIAYITFRWHVTNRTKPFSIDGVSYAPNESYSWSYATEINKTVNGYYVYTGSWRFLYVGTWGVDGKNGWHPTYPIGTAFTQDQQAAIDSGITKNMVDNYVKPTSTANTAYNKRITALETDKRDIINSANKVYATDANGANKNDLVYSTSATSNTIAQRGTNGVLKVGTPTDNADATTKAYVDGITAQKADKSEIPTKVSDLTNDSGFITSASVATLTDVNLTSLADGNALIYDANSGKWINGTGGVSASYDSTTKTITFA